MRSAIGTLACVAAAVGALFGLGAAEEVLAASLIVGESVEGFAPQRGHLVVLTLRGIVFWVDPARPDQLEGAVVPKGLPPSDTLTSIASRPSNGQVYVRSRFGGTYRLNLRTGAVKQAGAVSVAFGGVTYEAAAFSPVADRLRVVTDIRTNYLFNPRTGDAEQDVELATKGIIASIAYSPPVGRATTLYGIDRVRRELVRIGDGAVTAIGPLTVAVSPLQGFAIEQLGRAYAALSGADNGTSLYGVDLTTGATTAIGLLGAGGAVRGIAAI